MEAKVRRVLHFNDIEKMDRFCMLYGDLIQTLSNGRKAKIGSYSRSYMKGYEYQFVFHMSKNDFNMIKKNGNVRKISKLPYKDDFLRGYKKDIWVLC